MKKTKSFISIFLAVLMLCSLFVITAGAEDSSDKEIVLGNLKDGYQLCYTELAPPPWMKEFSVQYGKYIFRDFVKAGEGGHGFYVKKDDEKLMLSAAFEKEITDINEVVSLIKDKLPEKYDFSIINSDDVEKLVAERYNRDVDMEFVGTLGADFELFYSVPGDRGLCEWELEFTYGDYTFQECGGQTGNYEPEDLGLYVLNEGKILNIKEALNKIKVSLSSEYIYDLAEVINSKDLPYSFTVKHNTAWKYEDKFLEQYNINKEKLNPYEYSYSELYYHTNDKEEIDWALVDAFYGEQCDLIIEEMIGNRYFISGGIYYPFNFRYGVYDVKEDKFYDIMDYKEIPGKLDELAAVLNELNIGEETDFTALVREFYGDNNIKAEDIDVEYKYNIGNGVKYITKFTVSGYSYPAAMTDIEVGDYTLYTSEPQPVIVDSGKKKMYLFEDAYKQGIIDDNDLEEISKHEIVGLTKNSKNTTEPPVTTPDVTQPAVTNPAVTEPTQPASSKPAVISKKDNPVKVRAKTKTVQAKKLKKKKQIAKPLTIKNAQGAISVTKVKNGTNKKIFKKITVNKKTGAITFKKGKYKKKTYKIKLKIAVKGNANYNGKTITKVVKVKIK